MPDMKPQKYLDDRPAEYFDQFHESARKGAGWTYDLARLVITLPTIVLYRVTARCRGTVPKRVGGVFPVRRGHRDDKAFETAYELIDQGELLLVYAEGGRSRSRELGTAKPGIGRIALESGAPIIPTAIYGSG